MSLFEDLLQSDANPVSASNERIRPLLSVGNEYIRKFHLSVRNLVLSVKTTD